MSPARIAANTSAGSSSSGGTRRGGVTGAHGATLRSGRSRSMSWPKPGQVEHPADLVGVVLAQPEAVEQEAPCRRRHRPLDLEPDGFAEAPPPQLLLDRHEQVVGLVLLDREIGVAGHPEEVVIEDLHAEEQGIEVGLDHLVDEHEPRRLDHDQAGQDLGDLDPREAALAALRVAQSDGDRQAQRRDVRGTGGPDRPRAG